MTALQQVSPETRVLAIASHVGWPLILQNVKSIADQAPGYLWVSKESSNTRTQQLIVSAMLATRWLHMFSKRSAVMSPPSTLYTSVGHIPIKAITPETDTIQ